VTDRELQPDVEENKAVIRRFVDEVQNRRDWDVYDELNHLSFVSHSSPPDIPNDRDGGKAYAFPHAKFHDRRHDRRRRRGGHQEDVQGGRTKRTSLGSRRPPSEAPSSPSPHDLGEGSG
jgi:hypothetical protein